MHFKALLMVVHGLDCDAGEGNRRRGRGRYYTEVQGYEVCEAGGEIEDQSYYEKKEPDCGSEGTQESSTQDYKIWLIFRLGILSGMFFVLFAVLTVAAIKADRDIQWEPAFRMYRGLFLFILEFFLFGINLYGWQAVGINHAHICDFKNLLCPLRTLELAVFFAVVWGGSAVVFLFSDQFGIPFYSHPLALACFFLLFFINTLNVCFRHCRFWLLKALWRVLTAPFHHVAFADFWLADQLNSLVVAILDMEYLSCYYALDYYSVQDRSQCGSKLYGLRPLLACLPAWWRFAQSLRRYSDTKQKFPHLANAAKYSTTFLVVFFSTVATTNKERTGKQEVDFYFFSWIISSFVSTCYTYIWDVKMDWGLMQPNHGFLRAKLMFKHLSFYYFALISDLFLRLSWILTVSVGEAGLFHSEVLTALLAVLEVFRRFIWNFLRVENEHLSRLKGVADHSQEELREYDEDTVSEESEE
ncbi:solute carrier family 53 member 1-like [Acropora palmata]|uniref:solute carrier family 53 member 1-like n=1 Tax=Acropora palmata TaxID=6131 RepID=UPI003D9FDF88